MQACEMEFFDFGAGGGAFEMGADSLFTKSCEAGLRFPQGTCAATLGQCSCAEGLRRPWSRRGSRFMIF